MSAIKPVNTTSIEAPLKNTLTKKDNSKQVDKGTASSSEASEKGVVLELSNKSAPDITYKKPDGVKPNLEEIAKIKKQAEDALAPLKDLVKQLLKEQGLTFQDSEMKANEGPMVKIDDKTRAEAQKLIAEDGEYGIEKTSQRIVDMAKALSGNDKSKIEQLKTAIQDGFEEAKKAFGGELPEISKKTLDLAMKKIEEWQNSVE